MAEVTTNNAAPRLLLEDNVTITFSYQTGILIARDGRSLHLGFELDGAYNQQGELLWRKNNPRGRALPTNQEGACLCFSERVLYEGAVDGQHQFRVQQPAEEQQPTRFCFDAAVVKGVYDAAGQPLWQRRD